MKPHFLNHPPCRLSRHVTLGLTLVLSLGIAADLHAASFTWDSNGATSGVLDGAGTWNTTGNWWNGTTNVNWTNGTAGTTDTTEAIFGSNNGTAGNVTASNVILNKITFNPAGSGNYTLIGNSTVTLTGASGVGIYSNTSATVSTYAIINTTADKTINFVSNTGTLTISFGRLTRSNINSAQTFALAGASNGAWTTGINNPYSDVPISISKAGAGTWTLSGYNGYTGTTTISEGNLSVGMIGNPTGAVVKNGNAAAWAYTTTSGSAIVNSTSTTGLLAEQYFYSNATPKGAKILSVDSATQFTLESGTGVLAQLDQPMAVFGEASNMGLASAAASNLVFNGTAGNGALKYTGTTQNTGRAFTINSGKVANIEVTDSSADLSFVGATGAATTGALTKLGAGTLTLSGANTYTGATTITSGTLKLSTTGTIDSTSGVVIGAGEFNYNSTTALSKGISFSGSTGTLSGTGTITPSVTITSGNRQSAGTSVTSINTTATVGSQTFTNGITYNEASIFEWNLNANNGVGTGVRGIDYDAVNTLSLATTDSKAIFRVILNGSDNFDEPFWDTDRTWGDIFKNGSSALTIEDIFSSVQYYNSAGPITNANASRNFTISGTSLIWSAVPEATSALAGLLLSAGLMRRRR